jgi:hypothetical protein
VDLVRPLGGPLIQAPFVVPQNSAPALPPAGGPSSWYNGAIVPREDSSMPETSYTPEEIAARARELYERDIRPRVEPGHIGKYLVVDIATGLYEIDEDELAVMKRAAGKHPNGVLHLMRIGHRAVGRIGSRAQRSSA